MIAIHHIYIYINQSEVTGNLKSQSKHIKDHIHIINYTMTTQQKVKYSKQSFHFRREIYPKHLIKQKILTCLWRLSFMFCCSTENVCSTSSLDPPATVTLIKQGFGHFSNVTSHCLAGKQQLTFHKCG